MQLVRDYYKKIKESPNPHEIELNSFLQTLKLVRYCQISPLYLNAIEVKKNKYKLKLC